MRRSIHWNATCAHSSQLRNYELEDILNTKISLRCHYYPCNAKTSVYLSLSNAQVCGVLCRRKEVA
jgi:hypothetical protein